MIDSATLRLYGAAYNSSTGPAWIYTYRVGAAWDEATVSWSNRSTGTPWAQPGGDFRGTTGALHSNPYFIWSGAQSGASYAWYDLDVTSLISQLHAGVYPNYGIGLSGVAGNELVFVQSESTLYPAYTPQLVINGTVVPEPATLLLLGGAVLAVFTRRRKR